MNDLSLFKSSIQILRDSISTNCDISIKSLYSRGDLKPQSINQSINLMMNHDFSITASLLVPAARLYDPNERNILVWKSNIKTP